MRTTVTIVVEDGKAEVSQQPAQVQPVPRSDRLLRAARRMVELFLWPMNQPLPGTAVEFDWLPAWRAGLRDGYMPVIEELRAAVEAEDRE